MSGGQQGYGQSSYMPPSWAGGGSYGQRMGTGLGSSMLQTGEPSLQQQLNSSGRAGLYMPQGDMRGPWPGLGGNSTKMPGFVGGGYQAAWGPPPGRDMQHMESPAAAAGRTMGTGLASSMGQTGGAEGRPYQWGPVQPPSGGWYPEVTKPMPKADPMAGFQQLLAQDPNAAYQALNFNPAWYQQNQAALGAMVPGGDLGQWTKTMSPLTSNTGALSPEQRALIRQKMGW